ncbi:MAG: NUDIX hydrolase [Holophagae bacterium]|nr:NUDIX hydrolase [Holophagae bacterium]
MKIEKVHVLDHHTCRIWENGFFIHHAYLLQNEYEDGARSRPYRNEFFDRKGLDCVAVLPYRRETDRLEIGILRAFRPTVYFRFEKETPLPEHAYTWIYESVAGSLESGDIGEKAVRDRAVMELDEEAGFQISSEKLMPLGAGFFPSHGQSTEKIFLFAADVSGMEQGNARGDGSVNESLNVIEFHEINEILSMCREGRIEDPKIEIGVSRLKNVL